MPKNIELDISEGFLFLAKNKLYPIQAGHVKTSHVENGSVQWDWQIALELKKSDAIPTNAMTKIVYDDHTTFLRTRVIGRKQEGGLTILKLVPYMNEA